MKHYERVIKHDSDVCFEKDEKTGEKIRICVFWSINEKKAKRYGHEKAGYCGFLKLGDWMKNVKSNYAFSHDLWDGYKACYINMSGMDASVKPRNKPKKEKEDEIDEDRVVKLVVQKLKDSGNSAVLSHPKIELFIRQHINDALTASALLMKAPGSAEDLAETVIYLMLHP
jgi:hypothetical protein